MQQTVLLTAVRGPDGIAKDHVVKWVLRAYRRTILLSSLDKCVLETPYEPGGGSFMAPIPQESIGTLEELMLRTINMSDELPHHFLMHLAHASQIVGYKHPKPATHTPWTEFYLAWCKSMHMEPEPHYKMDYRLGDNRDHWLKASKTGIGMLESAGVPRQEP